MEIGRNSRKDNKIIKKMNSIIIKLSFAQNSFRRVAGKNLQKAIGLKNELDKRTP